MTTARKRYDTLTGIRSTFLDRAVDCSRLTLPYLIHNDDGTNVHRPLPTPWQSAGAKAVVTLASKLMMALLPPQTSFFKLQVRDEVLGEELPPEIRSELDQSFGKMERMVMDVINASSDRVVIHQALKHLIVGGNALLFMGKDGIKHFPLNRFVVNRDGNGNVLEIVTKELIDNTVLGLEPTDSASFPDEKSRLENSNGDNSKDVEVYTYVRMDEKSGRWVWHQEAYDKIIPGTRSTAPKNASPWLVLRFNTVDGEDYGRGRCEEFLGDLRSLESLSQSMVEGASVASKVIFLVSPSSTTKPQTIAQAGNGAIVSGRPEDVAVVQVGKQADFATAQQMMQVLENRIYDAFLVLQIRQSERTTAEEVRLTQMELEQQLGGLFSLLTVEFLIPYLNRTLMVLERSNQLPKVPKKLVRPTIVAGVNALGRGQDYHSLVQFITTISQAMGPEATQQYINPNEAIKRLATAQGIDTLGLVKSEEQMAEERQQAQQQAVQMSLVDQAGQLASSPMADPSKNEYFQNNDNDEGTAGQPGEPGED